MDSLRIGVVGGSIAGCAAAIELGRAGHEVKVFERSVGELEGRGAGVGTPLSAIERLAARDLVDGTMPLFEARDIAFVARSDAKPVHGHRALTLPSSMALLNWGDLWRNLRRRVPDAAYHWGTEVLAVDTDAADEATLVFADGSKQTFDLVIFGDGYRSLARRKLFPEVPLDYRRYVLWRGVREERELESCEPLEGVFHRVGYKPGLPGHAVYYLVPGAHGSVKPGERRVSFACYFPVSEEDLPVFLVDRDGRQRTGSLPPGKMRPEQEAQLKLLIRDHTPTYFSGITSGATNTFAQPIYNVNMPAHCSGRVCLFGDAGSLVQPFTCSGVFKATKNAIDLARRLDEHDDVATALAAWDRDETTAGQRLIALGEQMEKAFIWEAPDFAAMDEASALAWYEASVTLSGDFSSLAES